MQWRAIFSHCEIKNYKQQKREDLILQKAQLLEEGTDTKDQREWSGLNPDLLHNYRVRSQPIDH